MNCDPVQNRLSAPHRSRRNVRSAFTLIELMIVVALMAILLTVLGMMSIYALKSFAALGNYVSMDAASRNALDRMSRDIRQARELVAFQDNNNNKWMRLAWTNANNAPITIEFAWDSGSHTLTSKLNTEDPVVLLQNCVDWNFSFSTRAPTTNLNAFVATKNPSDVKMVAMTWKCERSVLGKTWNSESVQTAQIVLRNKQRD